MSLQDITITASIGSIATQSYGQRTYINSNEDQSFPLEQIEGNQAGSWPNLIPGTYGSASITASYTANLIVNISQAWSSSNVTPLGVVPFIHSTGEEFYNGEFSGSAYIVENGSLMDANCEQIRQVSPVGVAYQLVWYIRNDLGGGSFSGRTLNDYLNTNTTPKSGEILIFSERLINPISGFYDQNIVYLKIAKTDSNNNDNSPALASLTQITLNYIDPFSVVPLSTCIVITRTEFPDHFLYKIQNNAIDVSNSFITGDNNIPDHSLNVSYNGSALSIPNNFVGSAIGLYVVPALYNITTDAAGDFEFITDENGYNYYTYIPSDTPNYQFSINYSITANYTKTNPNLPVTFGLVEIDSGGNFNRYIDITAASLGSLTGTINMSGLYGGLIKGYRYVFVASKTPNLGSATVSNITWTFSINDVPISTAANQIFLEPYLTNTFRYSDCDVLQNNAFENDYSTLYREVLYENGGTIPSNQQQIISGTAQFAEINDYLYNASANRLPRYEGVRSESPDINQNSTFGGYGALPNVENLQTYFAYFDYLQDTSNELINKSAAHIRYLIDKDGNVLTPSSITSSYYYNLIDNFETDKYANLIINTENGEKIDLGSKKIIRPGVLPRVLAESQIGVSSNVYSPLIFEPPNQVKDYQGIWVAGPYAPDNIIEIINPNGPAPTSYYRRPIPISIEASSSKFIKMKSGNLGPTSDYTYYLEILESSDQIQIQIEGIAYVSSDTGTTTINWWIEKSSDEGFTWTPVGPVNGAFGGSSIATSITPISFTSGYFYPVKGDYYRCNIENIGGTNKVHVHTSAYLQGQYASYVSTTQIPTPIQYRTILQSNSPSIFLNNYWITGSSSKNIITSSLLLIPYINNYTQKSLTLNSGYGPNLSFQPQFKDTIRFEGNENKTYTILNVLSNFTESFNSNFNTWYISDPNLNLWTLTSTNATFNQNGGGSYASYITQSMLYPLNPNDLYYVNFTITSADNALFMIEFNNAYSDGYTPGSTSLNNPGYWFYNFDWGITSPGDYIIPLLVPPNAGTTSPDFIKITSYGSGFSSFTISNIYLTNATNTTDLLYLTLNQDVEIGTNLNSFAIRRLNPDPNYVVIDTPPTISGSGYLFPQYATNELRQNFDNIIVNLKERGLF